MVTIIDCQRFSQSKRANEIRNAAARASSTTDESGAERLGQTVYQLPVADQENAKLQVIHIQNTCGARLKMVGPGRAPYQSGSTPKGENP